MSYSNCRGSPSTCATLPNRAPRRSRKGSPKLTGYSKSMRLGGMCPRGDDRECCFWKVVTSLRQEDPDSCTVKGHKAAGSSCSKGNSDWTSRKKSQSFLFLWNLCLWRFSTQMDKARRNCCNFESSSAISRGLVLMTSISLFQIELFHNFNILVLI